MSFIGVKQLVQLYDTSFEQLFLGIVQASFDTISNWIKGADCSNLQ